MGDDIDSAAEGFRTLARRYGVRRILTLGYCVGCIGALRFGLLLGAEGVLGLHPRVQPTDAQLLTEKAGIRGARLATQFDRRGSVLAEYREAKARPKVSFVFGENCVTDVAAARSLAEVTEVTPIAIPGSSDMNTLSELLALGVLEPVLRDFVAGAGSNAPATRDLITSKRESADWIDTRHVSPSGASENDEVSCLRTRTAATSACACYGGVIGAAASSNPVPRVSSSRRRCSAASSAGVQVIEPSSTNCWHTTVRVQRGIPSLRVPRGFS